MRMSISRENLEQKASEMGFKMTNKKNVIMFYYDDIFIKQFRSFKAAYLYLYTARRTLKKGGTPKYMKIVEAHKKEDVKK